MPILFRILPAILCFTMLVPSVAADETYIKLDALTAAYGDSGTPVTESLYVGDYEEPQETTITTAPEETEQPTEAAETTETVSSESIPAIPEVTSGPDQDALLTQLVESQQNTEYATQLLSGLGASPL